MGPCDVSGREELGGADVEDDDSLASRLKGGVGVPTVRLELEQAGEVLRGALGLRSGGGGRGTRGRRHRLLLLAGNRVASWRP